MSKGILTLYVDNELKMAAKAKLINLSNMFNTALKVELDGIDEKDEKKVVASLKSKLVKALSEIVELKKTAIKTSKQLKDKQMKDEGWITT